MIIDFDHSCLGLEQGLGLIGLVLILSRPPGLARYLGLDPCKYHDVLDPGNDKYLKDTFDLLGSVFLLFARILIHLENVLYFLE